MASNHEFHWPTMDHNVTVAMIGVDRGKTMVKNMEKSFAPSMYALSSTSTGKDVKKFLIMTMVYALHKPGMTKDQIVLSICSSLTSK